jgi:hypothetical protein
MGDNHCLSDEDEDDEIVAGFLCPQAGALQSVFVKSAQKRQKTDQRG